MKSVRMPFGKYKGQALTNIPREYLECAEDWHRLQFVRPDSSTFFAILGKWKEHPAWIGDLESLSNYLRDKAIDALKA